MINRKNLLILGVGAVAATGLVYFAKTAKAVSPPSAAQTQYNNAIAPFWSQFVALKPPSSAVSSAEARLNADLALVTADNVQTYITQDEAYLQQLITQYSIKGGTGSTGTPTLSVSPMVAVYSTSGTMTFTGSGFPANSLINFTANGTSLPATATTGADGTFTLGFDYPGGGVLDMVMQTAIISSGKVQVTASSGNANASVTFSVTLNPSGASGTTGTAVGRSISIVPVAITANQGTFGYNYTPNSSAITGSGFTPNTPVELYSATTGLTIQLGNTDASGNINATVYWNNYGALNGTYSFQVIEINTGLSSNSVSVVFAPGTYGG